MANVEFTNSGNAPALKVLIVWRQDLKYLIFGVFGCSGTRIELPVIATKCFELVLEMYHLGVSDEILWR